MRALAILIGLSLGLAGCSGPLPAQSAATKPLVITFADVGQGDASLIVTPEGKHISQNNNSVGILLEYGSFRALFPGDAESEQLDHWMKTLDLPRVNVLRAWQAGGANVYRTDVEGSVLVAVQPDGKYQVLTANRNTLSRPIRP